MSSEEFIDFQTVAVEPDYCQRCGEKLSFREFDEFEAQWCSHCEAAISRCPVPGAHVVVHDDENVLVLDEPIPQHEGVLSLPGGYAGYHEHPTEVAVRELEEETGLQADPDDLRFLTVVHAELEDVAFYFLTYALEREDVDGELTPEAEGFEARFHPLADLRANPDQIRDNDLERIGLAFEE
ncbi:NUDIX hydrolase [Halobacterium wangiae]|uniref:NUDIX hydrolase n=1 Tax=Halobacterium wangiae TaxID=2902623 RepID=UPI001E3F88EC|nr:NUDIX domain-containing protein [Halobacterium wangiae]